MQLQCLRWVSIPDTEQGFALEPICYAKLRCIVSLFYHGSLSYKSKYFWLFYNINVIKIKYQYNFIYNRGKKQPYYTWLKVPIYIKKGPLTKLKKTNPEEPSVHETEDLWFSLMFTVALFLKYIPLWKRSVASYFLTPGFQITCSTRSRSHTVLVQTRLQPVNIYTKAMNQRL